MTSHSLSRMVKPLSLTEGRYFKFSETFCKMKNLKLLRKNLIKGRLPTCTARQKFPHSDKFIRFTDWNFIHRARLGLVDLHAYKRDALGADATRKHYLMSLTIARSIANIVLKGIMLLSKKIELLQQPSGKYSRKTLDLPAVNYLRTSSLPRAHLLLSLM